MTMCYNAKFNINSLCEMYNRELSEEMTFDEFWEIARLLVIIYSPPIFQFKWYCLSAKVWFLSLFRFLGRAV